MHLFFGFSLSTGIKDWGEGVGEGRMWGEGGRERGGEDHLVSYVNVYGEQRILEQF